MTFAATVVQVLVASPGDTEDERFSILRQASRWNGRHANGRGFILSPWLYELHSTPLLGDRAQAIINSQGVDKSDVVVAIFGTRLGTDTGVDISGTAEEINRAVELGIPVHVYFSKGHLPNDVDAEQLQLLRMFREDLMSKGLCGDYRDPDDLARQVIDAIEYDLDALDVLPSPVAPSGVQLRVRHDHRREEKGLNKRNQMEYRIVARDLILENVGDADAERLKFRISSLSEDSVHLEAPEDSDGWVSVGELTQGSSRSFLCFPLTGRGDVEILTSWYEDGNAHEKRFTTQIS